MENTYSICRICLRKKALKDISELKCHLNIRPSSEILEFCLDVQIEKTPHASTKLCGICFKKIMSFYKFKLKAQKNEAYLREKETEVVDEVLQDSIKDEDVSSCTSLVVSNNIYDDVKVEPKEELTESGSSDDELLSVIKKIKYESVTEDNCDESKENEPVKKKVGRRKGKEKTLNTRLVCQECGKFVRDLKAHSFLHQPASERRRIPCTLCEKTYSSYSARYKHNKIKHLGLKETCPICKKAVVNVRQHRLVVHESSRLPFGCVPCGRRFVSRSALQAHTPSHTREAPHACALCARHYRTPLLLLEHKRRVHDKEKSHICHYCSKSFFKKYHLQIHLRSHTKEKPFECPDCGKFFSSRNVLTNHRLVHSGVKPFCCQLCDMSFVNRSYLRVHMVSHTKEKRYPCKYCGLKFGRSDHRKRHEHTAHERHVLVNAEPTLLTST